MAKWLKKYMSIEHLESTLKHGELYMGNPERWPDKNDAAALAAFAHHTGSCDIQVACLTMAPDRSHFWDVFAGREDGVCLWFDYDNFVEDIKKDPTLEAGEVKYYTVAKLEKHCKASELALAKRKQYCDEKEFRVFRQQFSLNDPEVTIGLKFRPESLRRIYLKDRIHTSAHHVVEQRIAVWTSERYGHVKILRNRTRKYDRWINALNQVADQSDRRLVPIRPVSEPLGDIYLSIPTCSTRQHSKNKLQNE